MNRVTRRLTLVLAAAGLLLPPARVAADPTDELLRLVPPDTAVCFVVRGLRDQAKAVGASPFAAWATERIGPKVAGAAETIALKQLEQLIEQQIGVSLAELRDDILGDAIVLAYQPGPPGKPDAEHGAVMVKARDPAKLRKLIDRLNELQTDRGEISGVKEVAYKGAAYTRRAKADGKDEFYLLRDGLFVFSGQEAAVREVIDQSAAPAAGDPPVAASLKRLGVRDAFLTCWVNPRRFDADLAAQAAAAKEPGRKAFLQQFARVWAAVDGLAVYLDAKKDLELGVSVTFSPDRLPAEVRPLLATAPTRSAVWQLVPDDALFAAGGRVDVNALLAAVASFAPAEERAGVRAAVEKHVGPLVGKPNVPAVLAGFGPDWGVWVAPPRAGAKTWVPEWTAAVRLRDPGKGDVVRRGVLKALGFWAQLLQIAYNQKYDDQIDAHEEEHGGVEVTVLSNEKGFPPGFRPAFAVKDGYLVVAGSPEAVARFAAPPKDEPPAAEAPFLRLSGTAVRAYLKEHRTGLAKWLAGVQEKSAEQVAKDLGNLADLLEPVDAVELLTRGDEKRFGLALRVRLVKPLR